MQRGKLVGPVSVSVFGAYSRNYRHGLSNTTTWNSWRSLMANKKKETCARWGVFDNFLDDMGKSGGLKLLRKDPTGMYEPGNCYWGAASSKPKPSPLRRNSLSPWVVRGYVSGSSEDPRKQAAAATRRATRLHATPPWVDKKALVEIYANRPEDHHVDHIIPLINPNVCGLHVPWNLQYLGSKENCSKGNRF